MRCLPPADDCGRVLELRRARWPEFCNSAIVVADGAYDRADFRARPRRVETDQKCRHPVAGYVSRQLNRYRGGLSKIEQRAREEGAPHIHAHVALPASHRAASCAYVVVG